MNVILIGMKHCGKSSDGRALAAKWQCPFLDTDDLLEAHYARDHGQSLSFREIFAKHGEQFFRDLECTVVSELHRRLKASGESHVIAVGGGTVLNERVKPLLRDLGLVIYLEMSVDQLFVRVQRNGLPPFLRKDDPAAHFAELYRARVPHYQQLADLTVNVDGLNVDSALDAICRNIDQHVARGSHQTPRP
jgi:shikimate kinase